MGFTEAETNDRRDDEIGAAVVLVGPRKRWGQRVAFWDSGVRLLSTPSAGGIFPTAYESVLVSPNSEFFHVGLPARVASDDRPTRFGLLPEPADLSALGPASREVVELARSAAIKYGAGHDGLRFREVVKEEILTAHARNLNGFLDALREAANKFRHVPIDDDYSQLGRHLATQIASLAARIEALDPNLIPWDALTTELVRALDRAADKPSWRLISLPSYH
jgi:hypothetical protein